MESLALVRVERRNIGQRQDLAGVHIHDHGGRPLGLVLVHGVLQGLEHQILQAGVDRQAQIAAVHRQGHGLHVFDHSAQPVLDDTTAARTAGKLLIERQLDPFLPLVLDAVEAHHVGHHVAVRIIAAGFRLLMHARHTQLLDLVGHVHGDLALQVDEVLVFIDEAVAQVGHRRFQQLRQGVQLGRGGLLGVFGNGPDRARRHAGGQHRAVAVHDLAARGSQRQRAFIAPLALLLQELRGQPLQKQGAAGQHRETAEQQDQHQARAPRGQLPAQHGIVEEGDAFHCAPPLAETGA
ncbi:hypothetical protein D9M68_487370 [compost metagenome]